MNCYNVSLADFTVLLICNDTVLHHLGLLIVAILICWRFDYTLFNRNPYRGTDYLTMT